MERTTDLETIRKHYGRFTWGTVLKVHELGPYTIVEYDGNGKTSFHVYVDGKSTSNSKMTLDGAVLFAIAYKHLEANEAHYMAQATCKLLDVREDG